LPFGLGIGNDFFKKRKRQGAFGVIRQHHKIGILNCGQGMFGKLFGGGSVNIARDLIINA
jgi:hypothetical protein